MKLRNLICLIFILGVFQSFTLSAQEKPITIILLRHAEKLPEGKDPDLSPKGQEFATKLTKIFSDNKIEAAYTTAYKRTSQTITPLAEQNQLKLITYDPTKSTDLVKKIEASGSSTVLIAGHSNTVNLVYNELIKDKNIEALGDDEYRKIFIIYYFPKNPTLSRAIKLDLN
ncbi:MAG: phosphoglycerate mutase family protein [Bacteroidota bacterium]